MTDIAAIRKRDLWTRDVTDGSYRLVARTDGEGMRYKWEPDTARDAMADRTWLVNEVDRLTEELNRTAITREHARLECDALRSQVEYLSKTRIETSEFKAEQERDTARAEAQNEATQRKTAEAEGDEARAERDMLQFVLNQRNEQADQWMRERDEARAELEALRAQLPDAELAEIADEHRSDEDRERDQMIRWTAIIHEHRGTLLRALRAERARHRDFVAKLASEFIHPVKLPDNCGPVEERILMLVQDLWRERNQYKSSEYDLIVEAAKREELFSSCRPVVEAVVEFQACGCDFDNCRHLNAIINAEVPTLLEKP